MTAAVVRSPACSVATAASNRGPACSTALWCAPTTLPQISAISRTAVRLNTEPSRATAFGNAVLIAAPRTTGSKTTCQEQGNRSWLPTSRSKVTATEGHQRTTLTGS